MTTTTADLAPTRGPLRAVWLWERQGWINVAVAAAAMTATLPGRTIGLGLITAPLTAELGIGEVLFGTLNFWAILIGSILCLPAGWLIDRFGGRTVLTVVALALGGAGMGMSQAWEVWTLFLALTLVRGLGQGALSVVSMALIGKWFTRGLGLAMGVFAVLLSIGFITATLAVGAAVQAHGWRGPWAMLGACLVLGLAPLGAWLVRNAPATPPSDAELIVSPPVTGLTLSAALCTPSFWAFSLATSLFNLAFSAVTLFSANLLSAQGFAGETNTLVLGLLAAVGLPSNLIAGWLAERWPLGRLLLIGMLLLAGALAVFPNVTTTTGLILYALALGISGGIITVIFFAFYGRAFGRRHLGAVQAAGQIMTVLASASGPLLLAWCKETTATYDLWFQVGAALAFVLGLTAWLVRLPTQTTHEIGMRRVET